MIFLSYSRVNRKESRVIIEQLSTWGYEIYRDPQFVEGNLLWRNNIKSVWKDFKVMLILWSKDAAASPWVEHEIRAFKNIKIFYPLDDTPLPDQTENIIRDKDSLEGFLNHSLTPSKKAMDQVIEYDPNIQKRRTQKLNDYVQRLAIMDQSLSSFRPPERIAELTWQAEDGSLLREIKSLTAQETSSILLLGIKPVTNAQFSKFIKETNWSLVPDWGNENFHLGHNPVVGINWFEAQAYCKWLGGRLPTIDDWETAARAGDPSMEYATDNGQINPENCHFSKPFGEGHPIDPATLAPNPGGFYGMSGNVWDWCHDSVGIFKALKGGGYMDAAQFCKISSIYRNLPIDRDCCVGFRLMIEIEN